MGKKIPKLTIRYSLSYEKKRVLNTIKKIDWYKENNYRVSLPDGALDKDYRPAAYKIVEKKIEGWWRKDARTFVRNMEVRKLKPKSRYRIFLTRYGTGGSYDLPGDIVLNISQKKASQLHAVVFHEMIHLSIEPLIARYRIPHFAKERLVDLLLGDLIPGFAKFQTLAKSREVKNMGRAYGDGTLPISAILKRFKAL